MSHPNEPHLKNLQPLGDADFDVATGDADADDGTTAPPVRPAPAGRPRPASDRSAQRGSPPRLGKDDLPYLRDLNEAMLAQATPASSGALYLMALLLVIALGWSAFAKVEEVTRAEARVIPAEREQVITSLEGGIVGRLFVAEGDTVEADEPLLQLDPTRTRSQYREGLSRSLALKAQIARLRAEAHGGSPAYPPDVVAVPKLVRDENATFESRRRTLSESQTALQRSQDLLSDEIGSAQRLLAKGLYSKVELGRLQRQANEIQMQIDEKRNRFRADATAELSKLEAELDQLSANLESRLDVFQRTTIKSPIRGVVKNIRTTTLGSSVPGNSPIMEIIPLEGRLLLEARLKPADVAFVRPGQTATIKITAFDSSIFGDLKGQVQLIGPDTVRDDPRAAQQGDNAYYRMIVITERPSVKAGSKEMPIIPGMTGSVEVRTGEKTVLDYLLKPMFKAKEALRER